MKTVEEEKKTQASADNTAAEQNGTQKRKPFTREDKTTGFWRTLFPYMKPFKRNIPARSISQVRYASPVKLEVAFTTCVLSTM